LIFSFRPHFGQCSVTGSDIVLVSLLQHRWRAPRSRIGRTVPDGDPDDEPCFIRNTRAARPGKILLFRHTLQVRRMTHTKEKPGTLILQRPPANRNLTAQFPQNDSAGRLFSGIGSFPV
jgi:hypothetical protein